MFEVNEVVVTFRFFAATAHLGLAFAMALSCGCAPSTPHCYGDAQCGDGETCALSGDCVADAVGDDDAAGPGADDDTADDDTADDDTADDDTADDDTADDDSDGGGCAPWDGSIAIGELPFGPGMTARFRRNPSGQAVEISLLPEESEADLLWDLASPVPDEEIVVNETADPAEAWFAADFPDATYTTLLEDGGDVLGIFRAGPDGLELLGVASVDADRTKLLYDPPALLLATPLEVGKTWTVETTATGVYDWIWATASETYRFEVLAEGRVQVPAGIIPVLQVHLAYENRVPTLNPLVEWVTTRIEYLFVAQCYGVVARVVSLDDETVDPFTIAATYKRLGF